MLEFLKTNSRNLVDSVEIRGNEVAFLYSEALPVQKNTEIVDPQGGQATVCVESCRRNSGAWLHIGRIVHGALEATVSFQEEIRREQRFEIGLRVRSQQFPGYAAISNDLSERGLQLTLQEPLKVSSLIELAVDFDDGSDSLALKGVVRWCQLSAPNRVGIQFVDLTSEQRTTLRTFLQNRAKPRLPGLPTSVQRELSDGGPMRAEVLDAFHQEECVAIRLKRGEETLEYRYTRPEVGKSEMSVGSLIGQIESEPVGDGRFRYSYYNVAGKLALELVSGSPEITVSAA